MTTKSTFLNHGKRWTSEDDIQLMKNVKSIVKNSGSLQHSDLEEMSSTFQRTSGSIKSRILTNAICTLELGVQDAVKVTGLPELDVQEFYDKQQYREKLAKEKKTKEDTIEKRISTLEQKMSRLDETLKETLGKLEEFLNRNN